VRAGYEELLAQEPERWLRVDGRGSADAVFESLWRALVRRGLVSGEAA
jgi:thymidylate kinase